MNKSSIFNSSTSSKGEVMCDSIVRIDCKTFGEVTADQKIIVGVNGHVKGSLHAKEAVVFGKLEGDIFISGTIVLNSGSSITGNLYTQILEFKDGATINARVITCNEPELLDKDRARQIKRASIIYPFVQAIPTYSSSENPIFNTELPKSKSANVTLPPSTAPKRNNRIIPHPKGIKSQVSN